ncbi:MAG: chitobiase/beta-hexosaminidase C-terminal domain-containing protein, partial [Muribaculaceae bacterium]|nr:chitobiase/beta-hexosaminidase C-terminal domain-containing protein [Muribaculaceae bacterium]
ASEYAQQKPLFTDDYGMYKWDVPQGLWQVKFEKDGYLTAYSEWLPVPPPQLDVNIGIVQNKQPEVTEARAYEEGVEVQFDKYMDLSTLTADNIYVSANGEKLAGEVRLIDSALADEYADEEDAEAMRYASRVRFVPEEKLSATTGEIRVTVSRNVLSYAGIPMTETYSQVLDVEKEVQAVYADDVKVLYGGEKEVTVFAVPFDAAAGRTLRVATSSDLIASIDAAELKLDADGKAVVKVSGNLPGSASLSFTIDDVTVTGDCAVDVVTEIITAEAPVASRASGTAVYRGTKLELTTDSKDAVIYFTTDGSCPCDADGTRRKYTVPIVIEEDMHILAMTSVGNSDNDVSETVEFNYTIKQSDIDFQMEEGWTWISHNLADGVAVAELAADEAVTRILSQTREVIRDPQLGLTGTLTELSAAEGYKIEASAPTGRMRLSDVAWNPATPIALKAGWNWLGYPVAQTMSVDEALAPTEAEVLDMIVGQHGFAQYDGENWIGTLETMVPGMGYMYRSQSAKQLTYNTSIVSTAAARYAAGIATGAPLAVDIRKYAQIMPVVATLRNADGLECDNASYQVAAFCGTECRGIGKVAGGRVMMAVYGNTADRITFRVTDTEGTQEYPVSESLGFTENAIGDIFAPYAIEIDSTTGVAEVRYDGSVRLAVEGEMLRIRGIACEEIGLVELYDMEGRKLLRATDVPESGIRLPNLSNGVYVVTVKAGGDYTYHRIAIR